jgi:serralysin
MSDSDDALLDELIDGLLDEGTYDFGDEITYTFGLTTDIASDDANSMLNDATITRFLDVFDDVTAYTGLTFTEVNALDQSADLYFSFRENTSTAYVYAYNGGMMHVFNPERDTPVMGGYVDHLILHELGHGLGLEHGHDEGDDHDHDDDDVHHGLPDAYQGHSWSVMSYRAHPETDSLYFGDEHGPETFMIADIAALQYQFGANFNTQSDDTLYEVNFGTGELLINGVSQGVPQDEKMQRAIWDGGGIDTLDLANGEDEMTINLQPGAFTSFGDSFLPDTTGEGLYFAEGNIANPYLYDGNLSSLLENVIGGAFRDLIIGNVLDNVLEGGGGADALYGLSGDDTLHGGAQNDLIIDGLGNTTATGGSGNDTVVALSGASDLEGNGNGDVVIGGIDADHLSGGAGNDIIRGEGGRGLLFGNDVIDGGTGDDLLMGGRGVDQFVFRPDEGNDMIATFTVGNVTTAATRDIDPTGADFSIGVDTIKLIGFSGISAANVLDFVTDGDDGAVFSAQGTTITLYDVTANMLTSDDFVF